MKNKMIEITNTNYIYLYGKFYDTTKFSFPTEEQKWSGIIIYTAPIKHERATSLSSLEGLFVCDEDLSTPLDNAVILRTEMKKFADLHHGEFVSFKDHSPFIKPHKL
jgi:hypothetical protein